MKAYVDQDLIIGETNASNGVDIPDNLKELPQNQLRFDGVNLVDASTYSVFYIDNRGRKHISKFDQAWQQLSCQFDDSVVLKNNMWVVISKLSVYQDNAYSQFKNLLYKFVTKDCDFPEWKQINYLDRYYELNSKTNLTTPESTELIGLQNVRTWKNNLLSYRDQIKNNIYSATNTAGVDSVMAGVIFTNPPFDL